MDRGRDEGNIPTKNCCEARNIDNLPEGRIPPLPGPHNLEENSMRRLVLIAAVTLAGLSTAKALDCDNAPDQATMKLCADTALKATDKRLNMIYRAITRRLADDPEATKRLVTTQRAWIAFRDAECSFRSSGSFGGSAQPLAYSTCLDGMTRSRLDELKAYLACQEGDMMCPVPAE
jgi:uncharacterized protein YecT (DUF1311 family)